MSTSITGFSASTGSQFGADQDFADDLYAIQQGKLPGKRFAQVGDGYDDPSRINDRSAIALNFLSEKRISQNRAESYLQILKNPVKPEWSERHKFYLNLKVNNLQSETFADKPLHFTNVRQLKDLGKDTELFRFQSIRSVLNAVQKVKIDRNHDIHKPQSKEAQALQKIEAKKASVLSQTTQRPNGPTSAYDFEDAFIDVVFEALRDKDTQTISNVVALHDCRFTATLMKGRPVFAGFRKTLDLYLTNGTPLYDMQPDVCANVMLGHGLVEANPQLVFTYSVGLLIKELKAIEARPAFAVPTVLDHPFNPFFYPTPSHLKTGRALPLALNHSREAHCEILHPAVKLPPHTLVALIRPQKVTPATRQAALNLHEAKMNTVCNQNCCLLCK